MSQFKMNPDLEKAIEQAEAEGRIIHDSRKPKPFSGSVRIECPGLIVVSEANRRDHWAAKRKRQVKQADEMLCCAYAFGRPPKDVPLAIKFTRTGGKFLDTDNLAGAFKAVQDALAKWIGRDDGDPSLSWSYDQEPGKVKGIVAEVTIREDKHDTESSVPGSERAGE